MKSVIILDNRNFLVIDKFIYENKNYLYVVSMDGSYDITLLYEYEENGKIYVESVTDKDLINKIFLSISSKYKEVQNDRIRNMG